MRVQRLGAQTNLGRISSDPRHSFRALVLASEEEEDGKTGNGRQSIAENRLSAAEQDCRLVNEADLHTGAPYEALMRRETPWIERHRLMRVISSLRSWSATKKL